MRDWIRSSGLAGVLLVLAELALFLIIVNFLCGLARGDDGVAGQIRDIEGYLDAIHQVEAQETALGDERDTVIVCDEMEINHVFEVIEGDVYTHRLDQVLIRNRHHMPRHFDHNGNLLRERGDFWLIDGWAILGGCRRYDNKQDRQAWEDYLSGTLKGWLPLTKSEIRSKAFYWGEFVTPVSRVGEYHVLRLSGFRGTVTIKSKVITYTKSLSDLETDERHALKGRNRKYNLNQMRNAPTVVGEAAVRRR